MNAYYCDTNIFLRIFLNDNPRYKRLAESFIQKSQQQGTKLIVTLEILWEIEYILSKRYLIAREEVSRYLKSITADENFTLDQPEITKKATALFEKNTLDLVDNILMSKQNQNTIPIVTFDKNLANTSPDNLLLQNQL